MGFPSPMGLLEQAFEQVMLLRWFMGCSVPVEQSLSRSQGASKKKGEWEPIARIRKETTKQTKERAGYCVDHYDPEP